MNRTDLRSRDLLAGRSRAPGLNDEQIAALWGLTRSRIQQIRLSAIEKIRRAVLKDPFLRQYVAEMREG